MRSYLDAIEFRLRLDPAARCVEAIAARTGRALSAGEPDRRSARRRGQADGLERAVHRQGQPGGLELDRRRDGSNGFLDLNLDGGIGSIRVISRSGPPVDVEAPGGFPGVAEIFEDSAGQRVGWTELREGKQHLLAVFDHDPSEEIAARAKQLRAEHRDPVDLARAAYEWVLGRTERRRALVTDPESGKMVPISSAARLVAG